MTTTDQEQIEWVTYAYVDPTGQPRSGEGTIVSRHTDQDGLVWVKVANTYGFAADVPLDHPEYEVTLELR